MCGYTANEIREYYGHHINEIMRRHERTEEEVYNEIQRWYDGYMFSGSTTEPAVYNPVSIMQYFKLKIFDGRSFWAAKNDHQRLAVQGLLEVAIAKGRDLLDLEKELTYDQLYESTPGIKPEISSLESLLFQAGYLTIASHDSFADKYTLRIPNIEVQREFHQIIVEAMKSSRPCVNYGRKITKNFNDLKFAELTEVYNNFVRERYGMRVWNTAKDKENANLCSGMR